MWQPVKLTTSSCENKEIKGMKELTLIVTFHTIIWNNISRRAKNRFTHVLLFLYHMPKKGFNLFLRLHTFISLLNSLFHLCYPLLSILLNQLLKLFIRIAHQVHNTSFYWNEMGNRSSKGQSLGAVHKLSFPADNVCSKLQQE